MDALVSAACAGTHTQATVRMKCQLKKYTKAGDKRGCKGISPWKEKSSKKSIGGNLTLVAGQDWLLPKKNTRSIKQLAGAPEIKNIHARKA